VREHLAPHQRLAAGLRALPDTAKAMSHTQAAYRFYNNSRVGLPGLAQATLAALRHWVADISYIPTREGWLYLAAVEDLYSRMVVGWSMADTMSSRLVVDALKRAVQRRLPGEGLLAHSDRGSQYASEHYQRLLAKHGIECSRSGVGQCWDNTPMESFFASLKKELIHHEDYRTRQEARASIFEYIEAFYNPSRRHSSLDYLSPLEYEQSLQA